MSGYQDINIGTIAGDHTGEDPHTGLQKMKDMFKELFGSATNSYVSAVLTAASTDDYDPWGAVPPQDWRLDLNLTTNDCIITSLRAAFDGCRGVIRTVGTGGFLLTLTNAASTGTAANRFYGSGDGGSADGGYTKLVYYSLPIPRWYVG